MSAASAGESHRVDDARDLLQPTEDAELSLR